MLSFWTTLFPFSTTKSPVFGYKVAVFGNKCGQTIRRPIILRTACGIAAEPNRRNCHIWNSHGHETTLPMAIPDAKFSAVQFFAVCYGQLIHPDTAKVSEEVNRKCPSGNTTVQLSTPYTDRQRHSSKRHRRMDRQTVTNGEIHVDYSR